mgnify:CR=1 FL=1
MRVEQVELLNQLSRSDLYSVYQFLLLESQSPEELPRNSDKERMIEILGRTLSFEDSQYCIDFFDNYDYYQVPSLKWEMINSLPEDLLIALFSIYLDDDLLPETHEELVDRLSQSQFFLKDDARKFYLWFHYFRQRVSLDDSEGYSAKTMDSHDATVDTPSLDSHEPSEFAQQAPVNGQDHYHEDSGSGEQPMTMQTIQMDVADLEEFLADRGESLDSFRFAGATQTVMDNQTEEHDDVTTSQGGFVDEKTSIVTPEMLEEVAAQTAAQEAGLHNPANQGPRETTETAPDSGDGFVGERTNVAGFDLAAHFEAIKRRAQPAAKAQAQAQAQAKKKKPRSMQTIEISAFDLENYLIEEGENILNNAKNRSKVDQTIEIDLNEIKRASEVSNGQSSSQTQNLDVDAVIEDDIQELHAEQLIEEVEEVELSPDELVADDEEILEAELIEEEDERKAKSTPPPPPRNKRAQQQTRPGQRPGAQNRGPAAGPPPKKKKEKPRGATGLTPRHVDTLTTILYRASILGATYGRAQTRAIRIFFQRILECAPVQLRRVRDCLKKCQAKDFPLVPPTLEGLKEVVPSMSYAARLAMVHTSLFLLGCKKMDTLERYKDFLSELAIELRIDPSDISLFALFGLGSEEIQLSAQDCLDLLEIDLDATEDDIRKGHRKLVKRYHPDQFHARGPEFVRLAERKMKEINMALEILLHRADRAL